MTDNKYQNGKIYTIRNKNDDTLITLIYVGSTIQQLQKVFMSINKPHIMKNIKLIICYYIKK